MKIEQLLKQFEKNPRLQSKLQRQHHPQINTL